MMRIAELRSLSGDNTVNDRLELRTRGALIELKTAASVRISSLIKNDQETMDTELKIVNLAEKELDALNDYKKAPSDKMLIQKLSDLHNQRIGAYTHFRELGQ